MRLPSGMRPSPRGGANEAGTSATASGAGASGSVRGARRIQVSLFPPPAVGETTSESGERA